MPTLLLAALLAPPAGGPAEEAPPEETPAVAKELPPALAKIAADAIPLNAAGTVLLDRGKKRVVVRAEVCLRAGALEMFLCLPQTKEHESILKFDGDAKTLHAALVAAGITPGEPVSFDPDFAPPKGPTLDLAVHWVDDDGTARTAAARDWIRTSTDQWYVRDLAELPSDLTLPQDLELRHDATSDHLLWYGRMSAAERDRALALSKDEAFRGFVRGFFEESQPRPLDADFVFAGSYVWDKPLAYDAEGEVIETERAYAAEGGEVICVANFPAATIDIAERSSAEAGSVLYEAWTERIPPKGTTALLVLSERVAPPPAGGDAGTADAGQAGKNGG
jgi:hypothetical protein